ncbi:NAD(P)-binding protein [Plasmodium brasilianum]|uniref:NAD(P)-binding protein n=1 Tax=Plasmodium brasilianum TaxID=5824 RepID=A0ACB9YGR1_PLABR|nr:NAD(P)-binding protein [Plasmodium brasilianum]
MLCFIKKYIYFELLIILRVVNYWIPLSSFLNITLVSYLSVLGFIYLIFKFRYANYSKALQNCNFKGKHVCIIGGSEGLGLSLAKRLIKEKPETLSVMSRNINKLKEARNILLSEVGKDKSYSDIKINIIKCDLSMKESINEAFNNALINNSLDKEENSKNDTNYGNENNTRNRNKNIEKGNVDVNDINNIDVLICNAAYVSTEENTKLQMYDLIYTVNVNIYGNIDFISRVITYMKKKKSGTILFINSEGALYPIYGYSYYLMSKTSMWTYTHILDQELKYFNIHIANAFLPSIQTPGFVQENFKKPDVTKKIESLTSILNSDYAADKVINKIKQGRKFITLNLNGYMLSILHSGYRNPESYFDYLMHVSFCNIFVFISSLYKLYIEYVIKKKFHSILCN